MGRKVSKFSERKIAELIRWGYGSGELADYKPWFTVRDFSSRGITTRFPSLELRRSMLFLSNIELHTYLVKCREDGFFDYWEQLRLDRDETQDIAKTLGVKHPSYFGTSRPLVMTLDGVATYVRDGNVIRQAIDCKPWFRLNDPRTEEKLAIHRVYAERRGWSYERFTEFSFHPTAIENLIWMRSAYPYSEDKLQVVGGFELWAMRLYTQMKHDRETGRWRTQVRQYCYEFDAANALPQGCGIVALRILMYQKLVLAPSLEVPHLVTLRSPLSQLRLVELAHYGATEASWEAMT
jgi:hypothetical protein